MRLRGRTWYIAGPMTGLPEGNRPAFVEAERALRNAGYNNVVNPARFASQPHWQPFDYMRRAATIVGSGAIDGLVLLPGWQDSQGVKLELDVADSMGLAVYELDDLVSGEGVADE